MSRVAALSVVATFVVGAQATPRKPARVAWVDWVGDYRGTLTWSRCSTPGEKVATFAIDAIDGVMTIDLSAAAPGLRAMSLVADGVGWSARQGDVAVELARGKTGAVELAIVLDSGCTGTTKLVRARAKLPACERLLGWARVATTCSKLGSPPEDLAKLATLSTRDAASCPARAERLERALVDAGCAPHPDPQIGVRARACLELVQASERLGRCGRVPPPIVEPIVGEARGLAAAAQTAEPATLPYVEQQCRDAHATVTAVATRFGCS